MYNTHCYVEFILDNFHNIVDVDSKLFSLTKNHGYPNEQWYRLDTLIDLKK